MRRGGRSLALRVSGHSAWLRKPQLSEQALCSRSNELGDFLCSRDNFGAEPLPGRRNTLRANPKGPHQECGRRDRYGRKRSSPPVPPGSWWRLKHRFALAALIGSPGKIWELVCGFPQLGGSLIILRCCWFCLFFGRFFLDLCLRPWFDSFAGFQLLHRFELLNRLDLFQDFLCPSRL